MINIPNKNPLAVLEDEKLEHIRKLRRMEDEMLEMFTKKLNLKLEKMKDLNFNEIQKHENERKLLQEQGMEIVISKKSFEVEKNDFNRRIALGSSHAVSPSLSNKSATSNQSALYRKSFTFNIFT